MFNVDDYPFMDLPKKIESVLMPEGSTVIIEGETIDGEKIVKEITFSGNDPVMLDFIPRYMTFKPKPE